MDHESLLRNLIGGELQSDEPMSKHTTLRVGGPADYFLELRNLEDLATVLILAQQHNLPYFLLGDGSNICVGDAGIVQRCVERLIRPLPEDDCRC